MTNIATLQIVEILPTKVWIESGIMGERYVMRQHEGEPPFEYCVFNYDYAHTCNAQTMSDATAIAMSLTNERPIEHRNRQYLPPPPPNPKD